VQQKPGVVGRVDLDVYVATHRPEWQRLELLVRRASRPRSMDPAELDELVDLYQRAATHLSVIRTRTPDPVLVDSLSSLVTRARAATTGTGRLSAAGVRQFVLVDLAGALYERRWWILSVTVGCLLISLGFGLWIANDPKVAQSLVPASRVRMLCQSEFADYYKSSPAGSFAAQVWTNNALIAAAAITFGGLLGIPTLYVLINNAVNIGVSGGYLATCGKTGEFFTLILPHGMLELTAVFIAGATGLRMGWKVIDPGPRRRSEALAQEGRAAAAIAVGLVPVLAVSGLIEAFVTPSGLPPWARLAIGAIAELGILTLILVLGRRAREAGASGDLTGLDEVDLAPVAAPT
jgi:uncharacterized membrane protein SpoIIM required for sporulation